MPTLETIDSALCDSSDSMRSIFVNTIVSGLRKKSVTTPSAWAQTFRKMGSPFPGPWRFTRHPWLKAMHDSRDDLNVGKKSAQMGYSETVLNIVFYNIDVERRSCLYLMPTKNPDASDFSASRFSPAIDASDHLSSLFTHTNNIGHKRAGTTNLYIRGMRSRTGIKSIPTPIIVFDELDEMPEGHIPLAEARSDGQPISVNWKISTPTIPNFGIDKYYASSTQERFFFRCPSCQRFIDLDFPRNIVFPDEDMTIDSSEMVSSRYTEGPSLHYKCHECDAQLPHAAKQEFMADGIWVPQNKNGTGRGFYINHMYSTVQAGSPQKFISNYYTARLSQPAEQEFYNSKLGVAHLVAGANVNDNMLDQARGSYRKSTFPTQTALTTMGIDVGRFFHIVVLQWDLSAIPPGCSISTSNHFAKPRVVAEYKVASKENVIEEIARWGPGHTVIDAQPERRVVKEIADYFYGRVKLCLYGNVRGEIIKEVGQDHIIVVDRTTWLDLTLGRFVKNQIEIPADVDTEYREHIKALARVYKIDPKGTVIATYQNTRDDHYAHAQNYAEMGLIFAAGSVNYNIPGPGA